MKVAVLGGKLPGVAAAYLARKANWTVVAVDRRADAPVRGLANFFYCFDVFEPGALECVLRGVDFVVPAIAHASVLEYIYRTAKKLGKKIMYVPEAYAVYASIKSAEQLFITQGIPVPKPWPDCRLPIMAKPAAENSDNKVCKLYTKRELNTFCFVHKDLKQWVIQEFLEGPLYTLQIVAQNGRCRSLQVTELEMDETYSCKRVLAPAAIPVEVMQNFSDYAVRLADQWKLDGIMEIRAILHEGVLKMLGLNACMPGRTLMATMKSSAINPFRTYVEGSREGNICGATFVQPYCHVLCEHILVTKERIKVCGETIMDCCGPLHYQADFFGADEAITSFTAAEQQEQWVATLVLTASSREAVRKKEQAVIHNIMMKCGVHSYEDLIPGD
jgi:3-methylornithine--L-lysine ligase